MAYDEKYVKKAVDHVKKRMDAGDEEADAIAWAVIIFILPYKFFVPEYYRQTGRCPEQLNNYLTENG